MTPQKVRRWQDAHWAECPKCGSIYSPCPFWHFGKSAWLHLRGCGGRLHFFRWMTTAGKAAAEDTAKI